MVNDDVALCMCVRLNCFSANEWATFFLKPNVEVISLTYFWQLSWVPVLGHYLCSLSWVTVLG